MLELAKVLSSFIMRCDLFSLRRFVAGRGLNSSENHPHGA